MRCIKRFLKLFEYNIIVTIDKKELCNESRRNKLKKGSEEVRGGELI